MPQTSQSDYEYRGLMAEAWDPLRGDTSNWPDRAFYLELVRASGEPVLDVGCGTGRLLVDYASQGIDIDGVDNSPEMLALCREKAAAQGLDPALFLQQMQALELPRRYRTIIVPSSSFQLLTEPEDAREALHRFHDHLDPGGRLAMSFMLMWSGPPQTAEQAEKWHMRKRLGEREDWSPTAALKNARRSSGQKTAVRRWSRARYDSAAQLEHTEDRYEVLVDGEVVETEEFSRSPSARWYTQEQSLALVEAAGFEDVRLYSGFSQDTASADDRIWTATATAAR